MSLTGENSRCRLIKSRDYENALWLPLHHNAKEATVPIVQPRNYHTTGMPVNWSFQIALCSLRLLVFVDLAIADMACVSFRVDHGRLSSGWVLKVAGSATAFGAWDLSLAPCLERSSEKHGQFHGQVHFELDGSDRIEYKYVLVQKTSAGVDSSGARWEEGGNRVLAIASDVIPAPSTNEHQDAVCAGQPVQLSIFENTRLAEDEADGSDGENDTEISADQGMESHDANVASNASARSGEASQQAKTPQVERELMTSQSIEKSTSFGDSGLDENAEEKPAGPGVYLLDRLFRNLFRRS